MPNTARERLTERGALVVALLGASLGGCFLDRSGLVGDLDRGDAARDAALVRDAAVVRDGGAGGRDGGAAPDAGPPPAIEAVSPAVAAHGGRIVLTGANLAGATRVRIGGVDLPFTVGVDGALDVQPVPDAAPVGAVEITVETPAGSATRAVTLVHLVIAELDTETTTGDDVKQFVEVTTGVPHVDLSGYVLVAFDGTNDRSYFSLGLTTADAEGRWLAGNPTLTPTPAATFPNETLRQTDSGAHALALYQGAAFPSDTAATAAGLIDACVYTRSTAVDPELTGALLLSGGPVTEGPTADQRSNSLERCAPERRASASFRLGTPTPGAANGC